MPTGEEMKEKPAAGLERAIIEGIESHVSRIINEEAKAAGQRVEERVQRLAVDVAATISRNMSFKHFGNDLTIVLHNGWQTKEL